MNGCRGFGGDRPSEKGCLGLAAHHRQVAGLRDKLYHILGNLYGPLDIENGPQLRIPVETFYMFTSCKYVLVQVLRSVGFK